MSWGRTLSLDSIAPEPTGPNTPVIREGEDEYALKMQYALAVFELNGDYNQAGYAVFVGPDNYGRAMQAPGWRNDFDVQQELKRLRSLPLSDEALERVAGGIATDPTVPAKDRLGAIALIWEGRGRIKRGANVNIDNSQKTTNVLRVPAKPKTPEEQALFEIRFEKSQLQLVSDARSSR